MLVPRAQAFAPGQARDPRVTGCRAVLAATTTAERWFAPLTLTREPSDETVVARELVDEATLFGVLLKIGDLGLPLLAMSPASELECGR